MYFSLMPNDWNYSAFDENLVLLDRLKKQFETFEKLKYSESILQMMNYKPILIVYNARIYITLCFSC